MNHYIFPNQQGAILPIREGQKAFEVGTTFRFPMEFFHFMGYVAEGKIFYNAERKKWEHANIQKPVGHFEEGYGTEPFETWMYRQQERLVMGAILLQTQEE